jgi:hypothetical protein
MTINPFLAPSLETIVQKGRYTCYAEEVEAMRQRRMDLRLEWRRQRADTMAKNRVIRLAWSAAKVAGILVGFVVFSELLRLVVWTVLR